MLGSDPDVLAGWSLKLQVPRGTMSWGTPCQGVLEAKPALESNLAA